MSAAYIIETADLSAGVVIRERAGFRFFAASPRFNQFDRRVFKSVEAARRAVDGLPARG